MNKNTTSIEVFMEDRLVGKLALSPDRRYVFEYGTEWLNSGFSISPFYLPLKPGVFIAKADPFDGLFGVFNDSLPDGWGTLLIDRWLTENGIHPAKIEAMINLLRQLSVDVDEKINHENPMRQLIIATHSPLLVQLQKEDDLLFAMEATIKGTGGEPVNTLRCRPLSGTWRCDETEKGIGKATILAYLTTAPGAQISLIDPYP